MRNFLPIRPLVLVIALCLTAGCRPFATPGGSPATGRDTTRTTLLRRDSAGVLTVDARYGRWEFPLPAEERHFASPRELAVFAQRELSAQATVAGDNVVVRGRMRRLGAITWLDARTGGRAAVHDPVLAYLGGVTGRIRIGGLSVCVDLDGVCDGTPASYLAKPSPLVDRPPRSAGYRFASGGAAALPSHVDRCTGDGAFCAQYHSFFNQVDLEFLKYARIGANSRRTRGSVGPSIASVPCAGGLPLDERVNALGITIRTGEDDLRGGNDNAHAVLQFSDGSQVDAALNRGAGWGPHSVHTVWLSIDPPHGRPLGDLVGFTLRTTFAGGSASDNWDVDELLVHYPRPGLRDGTLVYGAGRPFLRMSGDVSRWTAHLGRSSLTAGTPVDHLLVTIRTGDNLRGTNDNAYVVRVVDRARVLPDVPLNNGAEWRTASIHTVRVSVPANTELREIERLGFRTTLSGGLAPDHWGIDDLVVEVVSEGRRHFWFQRTGSPWALFSSDHAELLMDTPVAPADRRCATVIPARALAVEAVSLVKHNDDPFSGTGWSAFTFPGARVDGEESVEVAAWGFSLGVKFSGGDFEPGTAPDFEEVMVDGVCSAHSGSVEGAMTGNGNHFGAVDARLCPTPGSLLVPISVPIPRDGGADGERLAHRLIRATRSRPGHLAVPRSAPDLGGKIFHPDLVAGREDEHLFRVFSSWRTLPGHS
ncbi:MAG TPA: hypothetical protein VFS20_01110 [Longimicrobium sp.]|nr:hypothetical protein [Longimicrobium sp.]